MYNNLDALQKIGVLIKKKVKTSPFDAEHSFLERTACAIEELDSVYEDLKDGEFDPKFKEELYSILKQAMEERLI